jgi:pyruvate,water dikinase
MLRWLNELTDRDFAAVGPKIARLGTLRDLGIEVPDGFAVTTDAFTAFLAGGGLGEAIDRELASLAGIDDFAATDAASLRLRAMVEAAPLDAGFAATLRDAYEELCLRNGDVGLAVAVRSSAAGEDAAHASFAGQYETYLGVVGADQVIDAIRKAWSSLFVARALSYRLQQKRLVNARCAGVAFSADPVSGKRDRFVIEGSWGWGESVVQGTVEPDHVEVDRVDGRVLSYRVGDKRVASVFDRSGRGVVEQPLPSRFHRAKCLTDDMLCALWSTIAQIERSFGKPIDIEWVIEPGWRAGIPVAVVQVRPITTLNQDPKTAAPPKWDPLGYASKYGLGLKPKPSAAAG